MNNYLISYATPNYYKNQRRLNKSALAFGVDEVESYTRSKIKRSKFYRENRVVLDKERGSGYWLWKPYIILDFIEQMDDGDLLIYMDTGVEIIRDITPLVDICTQQGGILLFGNHGHLNKVWTKRDCFVAMDCDSDKYYNSEQITASFQFYIKNERSLSFLREYLFYCQNPSIITDIPNICGLENFPEFVSHRHDQSVLSLLSIKYNIEIFRDPCQWSNHMKMEAFREENEFLPMPYSQSPYTNSNYHTLLNHHRERPLSLFGRLKRSLRNLTTKVKITHE